MVYDQEVMGSNPGTVYWMDVSDLLAITLKKNWKIKVAKWGTPKKYLKKKMKIKWGKQKILMIRFLDPTPTKTHLNIKCPIFQYFCKPQ